MVGIEVGPVADPVPPREVEFWRDHFVDGNRVGVDVIAMGLEPSGGTVVVARLIRGKPAVTMWFNAVDAADDLGADHISCRSLTVVSRARNAMALRAAVGRVVARRTTPDGSHCRPSHSAAGGTDAWISHR